MVRRALAAVEDWDLLCSAASGAMRKPSAYFDGLRHCESCIAASWQAFEFGRKALGVKLFESRDGSVYERMNGIYNTGRHFDPGALPAGSLHAVWFAQASVRTEAHVLQLDELRDVVAMLGRIAHTTVTGPERAG